MTSPLVALAAGGSGGHVFPAEALAQELLAQGYRLALITDRRGAAFKGTLGQIETHRIAAGAIAGRGLKGRVIGGLALAAGTLQALLLLRRLKPSVVVGFGGYASAPPVVAAVMLGIRAVIHEQNAILGRANRLIAARVDRICTSFDLASPAPSGVTVVRTGLPLRPAVLAQRGIPYQAPTADGPFRVLVLGGSQGARVFSDVLPEAIVRLPESLRKRLAITQQSRPEDIERVRAAYATIGANVELKTFFDNVPELLAKAHLLIARSGASTVAEASIIGRPSILVPLARADGDQPHNAEALTRIGGAWTISQTQFTPQALAEMLTQLAATPSMLVAAAAAAETLCIPDAARRLAQVVSDMTHDQNGAAATNGRSVARRESVAPPNSDRAERQAAWELA